jgi:hypothetical protein
LAVFRFRPISYLVGWEMGTLAGFATCGFF